MTERIDRRNFCFGLGAAAFLHRGSIRADEPEVFTAETYRNARNQTMRYRLVVPSAYEKQSQYPLVLWLSGAAGRGSNNRNQISFGNVLGAHVWTTPENQTKRPCFVVAPQCPDNEGWSEGHDPVTNNPLGAKPAAPLLLALEIVRDLQNRFRIDLRRLYVAGQSMGGFGTWSLIEAYPKMFAAAIPLCGGGDPTQAAKLTKIPIWAFHGAKDESVSVEGSRSMIAAIRKAGGNPRYTEYPDTNHDVWTKAFNEPELVPWVFGQKRS
jgi:predicted peptidase